MKFIIMKFILPQIICLPELRRDKSNLYCLPRFIDITTTDCNENFLVS